MLDLQQSRPQPVVIGNASGARRANYAAHVDASHETNSVDNNLIILTSIGGKIIEDYESIPGVEVMGCGHRR
jgi:hypothetical protein